MDKIQKQDFIEIEFTGKTEEGNIFDSNVKEDLKQINPEAKAKPFTLAIGEKMFLEGVESFLIGKDVGKEYNIELEPEKAFGPRKSELVKLIPLRVFREKQADPQKGMVFDFDGQFAKIISVSGGRVIADFNNPLAGKKVTYKVKVNRKVDDLNEKAKALVQFFTRQDLKFEIKDKKLIVDADKQFQGFLAIFKDKFKELLDLDLEMKDSGKNKDTIKEE